MVDQTPSFGKIVKDKSVKCMLILVMQRLRHLFFVLVEARRDFSAQNSFKMPREVLANINFTTTPQTDLVRLFL